MSKTFFIKQNKHNKISPRWQKWTVNWSYFRTVSAGGSSLGFFRSFLLFFFGFFEPLNLTTAKMMPAIKRTPSTQPTAMPAIAAVVSPEKNIKSLTAHSPDVRLRVGLPAKLRMSHVLSHGHTWHITWAWHGPHVTWSRGPDVGLSRGPDVGLSRGPDMGLMWCDMGNDI